MFPNTTPLKTKHFQNCLQSRPSDSHKGLFGTVGIIGGESGMCGAAILAGRSALLLGAGKVYVNILSSEAPHWDSHTPELMLAPLGASSEVGCTALAIGPGLGDTGLAQEKLLWGLRQPRPLVLDADALNILAHSPELMTLLRVRTSPTCLTPHPGEAARLLGWTASEIQSNRTRALKALIQETNAHVLLKGRGSLLGSPDNEEIFINTTGNPGLSSAGMGDVLTGMLAALLAQGYPPAESLCCATHLHGAAADHLVNEGTGPVGLLASEVALAARKLFNEWIVKTMRSVRVE